MAQVSQMAVEILFNEVAHDLPEIPKEAFRLLHTPDNPAGNGREVRPRVVAHPLREGIFESLRPVLVTGFIAVDKDGGDCVRCIQDARQR